MEGTDIRGLALRSTDLYLEHAKNGWKSHVYRKRSTKRLPCSLGRRPQEAIHKRLYIDGGRTIQSFLEEDLIDEMIITVIPIVLGRGIRLFEIETDPRQFMLQSARQFGPFAQAHFIRKRLP